MWILKDCFTSSIVSYPLLAAGAFEVGRGSATFSKLRWTMKPGGAENE
jgi:hypothetical protein